jgi:xanthine/uracil permease
LLPFLIVLSITSVETVGDVAATAEISKLPVEGVEQERRIRGSMLNDGISSLFSALGGSLPLTTFAQVSSVI